MSKKIFDIIPPEKIKEEEAAQPVFAEEKKKAPRVFLKVAVFLFVLLAIFLTSGFFLFPEAKIKVWPKTRIITARQKIVIDLNADFSDIEKGIIPGKFFEKEGTFKKTFFSTGKAIKKQKAVGTITVYNEYSTSARTLVPSRFVSADGKLFWSTEKITIPGASYKEGRLVPGEKEVKVEAAKAGEEYNIEATTFALPALAGSPLYTTIYAKSFSPMTGGFIGEASQITEEDFKKAEDELIRSSKEESLEALKSNLPEGFILTKETVYQEILETSSSNKVGDLVDSFDFEAKINSNAFVFKEADAAAAVDKIISRNIEEDEKLKEKSLAINYSFESVDIKAGKMILTLNVKVEVYKDIDMVELKKALLAKSLIEAEMFLNNLPEISKVELKNKPFLRKNLPADLEKIKTVLMLD